MPASLPVGVLLNFGWEWGDLRVGLVRCPKGWEAGVGPQLGTIPDLGLIELAREPCVEFGRGEGVLTGRRRTGQRIRGTASHDATFMAPVEGRPRGCQGIALGRVHRPPGSPADSRRTAARRAFGPLARPGSRGLPAQCLVMEEETRVIEFTAEAGRAYLPLAADKCGRKWIWIADAGPYGPEEPKSIVLAFSAGLPTVGGQSPPEDSC